MIPTFEEYKKAKGITDAYEANQAINDSKKIDSFREDLIEYFANNLIDGQIRLEKFTLRVSNSGVSGDIIPEKPCLDENYDGGNNEDIKRICDKHGVDFRIVYWCYHK